MAFRFPPSICCQPLTLTTCVQRTYLSAPGTDVQLSSISFDPKAFAVSTGAESAVPAVVAVGVGVGVDLAIAVAWASSDQGLTLPSAAIERTRKYNVVPPIVP